VTTAPWAHNNRFGYRHWKTELPWVEFTDEQALNGMLQNGFATRNCRNFVEMGNRDTLWRVMGRL